MQRGVRFRALDGDGVPCLESFEPRMLLSAPHDFAGVGVRFDGAPRLFYAEGVIAEDDSIEGTMQFADAAGVLGTDPMDWTSLVRGDNGAMSFATRDGFAPYASQTGTQFIVEDRWLRGSFVGRDAQGAVRDFAMLAELENSGLSPYFIADIGVTRVTSDGTLETFALRIELTPNTAPGTSYRFTYELASGTIVQDRVPEFAETNRISFGEGGQLIFPHRSNANIASVFFTDFEAADGIVGIGVGRIGGERAYGDSGRYRSAVLVEGPIGAAFFGVDPDVIVPGLPVAANVVIELNYWNPDENAGPASTFRIFRQSEWDAGMRTPITQGTWVYTDVEGLSFIRLTGDEGATVTVRQTMPRTLLFSEASDATDTESLQGLGAAIVYRAGAVQEMVVEADGNGHPIAFLQFDTGDGNTAIFSIDLVEDVGGEAVTGSLATWLADPYSDGSRYVAGRSASGDVLLWRLLSDGVSWGFINLTDALAGARPIASDLFNTGSVTSAITVVGGHIPSVSRHQTLAGYDAGGNFVVYRFNHESGLIATSRWEFEDIEAAGVDGTGVVPELATGLSGWNSGWGASHFAGVDSLGQLWSIWWAPGMERWRVDSLSASAGGPALAEARPTAVTATWDAFHISAIDTQGRLVMTWWAPGFDAWHTEDLTVQLDGPTLQAGSLASDFNRRLVNLNIVGLDADGHARIYWWNIANGWSVGDLSLNIEPSDLPQAPWRLTHSLWVVHPSETLAGSQSLLGRNDDGDLVRLIWRSHELDAWVLENVTDLSMPYVV